MRKRQRCQRLAQLHIYMYNTIKEKESKTVRIIQKTLAFEKIYTGTNITESKVYFGP